MTNTAPTVRFRKLPTSLLATSNYEVLVDGVVVGRVYAREVTSDIKPRGSRIVTTRRFPTKWTYVTPRQQSGEWRHIDTRREALSSLLRSELGLTWDQTDAALAGARNLTAAETKELSR